MIVRLEHRRKLLTLALALGLEHGSGLAKLKNLTICEVDAVSHWSSWCEGMSGGFTGCACAGVLMFPSRSEQLSNKTNHLAHVGSLFEGESESHT